MIRFTLTFLLWNMYSSSFGNPLPTETSNSILYDSMISLAKRCENSFLTGQINSKLNNCSVIAPPYTEKQFECLIFYDINSQLCDAVAAKKIALTEYFTDKINVSMDVGELCLLAKNWNISDIKEYPSYKKTVTKIFSNSISCGKVCGIDDLTSQDVNYFCKYYKWGSDMLTQAVITIPSVTTIDENDLMLNFQRHSANVPLNVTDSGKKSRNESEVKGYSNVVLNSKPDITVPVDEIEIPSQVSSTSKQEIPSEVSDKNLSDAKDLNLNDNIKVLENIKILKAKTTNAPILTDGQPDKSLLLPPNPPVLEETLKAPSPKDTGIVLNSNQSKQNNPELDDYQDTEEVKGSLNDIQGDDDGDDNMLGDPDLKQDQIQTKHTPKKIETPMSSYGEEIQLFSNTMQEAYPNTDDHFFPFFLTAVILVVLLYVLYHNKSKVSKVFLGLIVEGRKPGRRRNSRGHAYRRLDTLEQAMSANTDAAPSKIIY